MKDVKKILEKKYVELKRNITLRVKKIKEEYDDVLIPALDL